MLTFQNPTELDLRLTQILGASVKTGDSPIGHFGSGLKYGIAIVLRLGGTITLYSGLERYDFYTEPTIIRGKEFFLVWMQRAATDEAIQLPFTLDFGASWAPWQAYREFWANAMDERGCVAAKLIAPRSGFTTIHIACEALDRAHQNRREFILESTPIHTSHGIEIHRQGSNIIYYQGLKVFTTDQPGYYTYNLTSETSLTEDRTLSDWWNVRRRLIRALAEAPDELLGPVLLMKDCWEWQSDWECVYHKPEPFIQCITRLAERHRHKLPPTLISSALPKQLPPALILTKVESMMLERAKTFCVQIGQPIEAPIMVVESLGEWVLGSVHEGKILLTREAFRQGTKIVAGTLLEEHIHLTTLLTDNSRGLQNHLLNLVISLGEELRGEPL